MNDGGMDLDHFMEIINLSLPKEHETEIVENNPLLKFVGDMA